MLSHKTSASRAEDNHKIVTTCVHGMYQVCMYGQLAAVTVKHRHSIKQGAVVLTMQSLYVMI